MRVVVIGGSGYIGRAIVERLAERGDTPVVVSRSESQRLPAGAQSRAGDVRDPSSLVELVGDADAVVHAAAPAGDWDADLAAVRAILDALCGSGKAFLYTSGIWSLGPATADAPADENAPTDPLPISRGRPDIERAVLDAADDGVRALVVRPGIVYGHGGGIPSQLVDWAREHGSGRYVGENPEARWPMVHVDDLAELYLIALDRASADTLLHATSQPGVPVGDLAAAADRAAGGTGSASGWPFERAAAALGRPYTEALAHDQVVESPVAKALGWRPRHVDAARSLVEEYAA